MRVGEERGTLRVGHDDGHAENLHVEPVQPLGEVGERDAHALACGARLIQQLENRLGEHRQHGKESHHREYGIGEYGGEDDRGERDVNERALDDGGAVVGKEVGGARAKREGHEEELARERALVERGARGEVGVEALQHQHEAKEEGRPQVSVGAVARFIPGCVPHGRAEYRVEREKVEYVSDHVAAEKQRLVEREDADGDEHREEVLARRDAALAVVGARAPVVADERLGARAPPVVQRVAAGGEEQLAKQQRRLHAHHRQERLPPSELARRLCDSPLGRQQRVGDAERRPRECRADAEQLARRRRQHAAAVRGADRADEADACQRDPQHPTREYQHEGVGQRARVLLRHVEQRTQTVELNVHHGQFQQECKGDAEEDRDGGSGRRDKLGALQPEREEEGADEDHHVHSLKLLDDVLAVDGYVPALRAVLDHVERRRLLDEGDRRLLGRQTGRLGRRAAAAASEQAKVRLTAAAVLLALNGVLARLRLAVLVAMKEQAAQAELGRPGAHVLREGAQLGVHDDGSPRRREERIE
eukprot:6180301-Pleurochrysis_carterae.AAC.4